MKAFLIIAFSLLCMGACLLAPLSLARALSFRGDVNLKLIPSLAKPGTLAEKMVKAYYRPLIWGGRKEVLAMGDLVVIGFNIMNDSDAPLIDDFDVAVYHCYGDQQTCATEADFKKTESVSHRVTGGIGPHEIRRYEFNWTKSEPKDVYFMLELDPKNEVSEGEAGEKDNKTQFIRVPLNEEPLVVTEGYPDITCTGFTSEEASWIKPERAGNRVVLAHFILKNIGTVNITNNFEVEVYYRYGSDPQDNYQIIDLPLARRRITTDIPTGNFEGAGYRYTLQWEFRQNEDVYFLIFLDTKNEIREGVGE